MLSLTDTPPDRVAFAGDWHANSHYARRAIMRLSEDVKMIIHVGDFGFRFEDGFLNAVTEAAERNDRHLLFIRGNHDDPDFLSDLPSAPDGLAWVTPRIAWIADGTRWKWNNTTFLAVGGASSIDRSRRTPGSTWWYNETVAPYRVEEIAAQGHADVLITHDGPFPRHLLPKGPGWPTADLNACEQHRQMIESLARRITPTWWWHGHYHQRVTTTWETHTQVTCLDCDGNAFTTNMDVVTLSDLAPRGATT